LVLEGGPLEGTREGVPEKLDGTAPDPCFPSPSFRVGKSESKVTLIFKLQETPYGTKELNLNADQQSQFEEATALHGAE
jgi:hypothetical protein